MCLGLEGDVHNTVGAWKITETKCIELNPKCVEPAIEMFQIML